MQRLECFFEKNGCPTLEYPPPDSYVLVCKYPPPDSSVCEYHHPNSSVCEYFLPNSPEYKIRLLTLSENSHGSNCLPLSASKIHRFLLNFDCNVPIATFPLPLSHVNLYIQENAHKYSLVDRKFKGQCVRTHIYIYTFTVHILFTVVFFQNWLIKCQTWLPCTESTRNLNGSAETTVFLTGATPWRFRFVTNYIRYWWSWASLILKVTSVVCLSLL